MTCNSVPASASQTRTVRSSDPLAIRVPSGEKAKHPELAVSETTTYDAFISYASTDLAFAAEA